MKIIVFGASGRTGQELVNQALAAGHHVTAFLREPKSLSLQHANLTKVEGNLRNPTAVETAVAGHDAVLSALGTADFSKQQILEPFTYNLIAAMRKAGIKRFVNLSAYWMDSSVRNKNPILVVLTKTMMRYAFTDKQAQLRVLKTAKNIDWIDVRPVRLVDETKTGYHVVKNLPKINAKLSRAKVAEFMLKQLTDDRFIRKSVIISG